MYDKLKLTDSRGNPLRQYHHMTLDKEFRKDCLCHRLHRDLELIATGAAIRKAIDIQFLVHTTVLLIAQQSVNSVLQ